VNKAPFRDAFVMDYTVAGGRRLWICPNCSGDCYGSSYDIYYCHGSSEGTSTEQSSPCGFWQNRHSPLRNGLSRPPRTV
jgi:hypothetical protein